MTMVKVHTPLCPECQFYGEIYLTFEDWEVGKRKRRDGDLIQNCFPTLTPAEREQLLNGYHEDCWDKMFGKKCQ